MSLREAVGQMVAELRQVGPVSRAELIARVLQRHPSHARRPEELILAQARQHPALVRLDGGSFAARDWILQGLVFRYAPDAEETATGRIALFPCFTPFLPIRGEAGAPGAPIRLTLRDEATGDEITRQESQTRRETVDLGAWLGGLGFSPGDSLLLTITDPAQGVFLVRREAAARADHAMIATRDAFIEEALFDLVSHNGSEQPFLEEIIPAALARLSPEARTAPGNHWHQVVAASARLRLVDDYALARATFRRPIDRLFGYAASPAACENLEARIDAFNADVAHTLREIGVPTPPVAPALDLCGRDEALHRSTRQIASYLASLPDKQADCYRCLAVPSIYLAKHEGTSLADADFGMLCRFLLSYYPRRVFFNRKSFTARMLATLRHFYKTAQPAGAPVAVTPHRLSRLHGLVDRKIALYAELDMDGPASAHLFAKLFPNVDADDAEVLPLSMGEIVLAS